MSNPNRKFVMAAILAALSAASFGAQAADQSAFFDQQREISDGYYPQYRAKDTSQLETADADAKQATWFRHQLAKGTVDTYGLNPARPEATETAAAGTPGHPAGQGSVAAYSPERRPSAFN